MLFVIDVHSGVPIYRQLMDQITRQILAGQLRPGEQLPTVRDLAARLKINPMTISKAYSLLESNGILERQRGVGLFAAAVKGSKADQVRRDILHDQLQKAAVMAIQMKISLSEVIEQLRTLYKEFDRMEENQP
jgi:GntR family transcriptional regulator